MRSRHSFCSTVPRLTTEGRYPLCYPMKLGLSSPFIFTNKSSDNLFITEPGVLTLGGVDTDFHDNKGNLRVKLIRVR